MPVGDMGEMFKDWAKVKQDKRARNRDASAALLTQAQIPFVVKNEGAHLIVDGRIDFWPGTGKWIQRGTSAHHRGVEGLIRFVRATAPK